MGLVPSETKTDLVAALAGVIPQPSLRAERAHRKEKGNVAAPSSDRVCNARMDAGSVGSNEAAESPYRRVTVPGGRRER